MRAVKSNRLRKVISAFLVIVVIASVFVWRFHVVNAECPAPVLDTHSLNEPVFHNGVEYTLSDYAVLSEDEFCKQFNIDPLHVKAYGLHSKIIVFTMYAKNVSEQNVDVDFAGQMLLQLGNYTCTYMCYIPLFQLLNPDKPTAGTMLPGHDIELTIPYQIIEYDWNENEYENLENETTQIVFSLYPVKKSVLLHTS